MRRAPVRLARCCGLVPRRWRMGWPAHRDRTLLRTNGAGQVITDGADLCSDGGLREAEALRCANQLAGDTRLRAELSWGPRPPPRASSPVRRRTGPDR